MKKQYHDDGVSVTNYDDGRIKVKLPTKKFNHLKSLVDDGGPLGIYNFLRSKGFKDFENTKSYIEQHTGHVCYVYRPPKEKVVRVEPEDTVEDPAPAKPKPKKKSKKAEIKAKARAKEKAAK